MTERSKWGESAEDVVNDTTPTNDPAPTPADSDLSPTPDDRGKSTKTGDAGDVPEPVKKAIKEERNEAG